jgi:hypothetical protein
MWYMHDGAPEHFSHAVQDVLNNTYHVGFEVFTAVVMKYIISWDMTLCSLSSFSRRFGGKYRLHLQGRRNKFSKNQLASRWPPPKHRLKLDELHGVISQKMILFNTYYDRWIGREETTAWPPCSPDFEPLDFYL